MRVVFVAALPPERSSFIGRILPLAEAAQRTGHAVDVLTLSGAEHPPFASATVWRGVQVRTVGPNLRPTASSRPPLQQTWSRYRAGRAALSSALRMLSADVLVLAKPQLQNTPPVLASARRRNIPLLLDVDDLEGVSSRLPRPARWYAGVLETRAARAARTITACSPFLVERFRRANLQTRVPPFRRGVRRGSAATPRRTASPRLTESASKIELLPTGIDIPPSVQPARMRERLALPPDATIILYVGSLSLSSGHRVDQLLAAFAELCSGRGNHATCHLVLAGDGLDERSLRGMAARSVAANRIHFLGRFSPPEDLALAYDADLLVDPVDRTPTNEAKSSHRVMLALATGTPVVAGDVGIRSLLLPPALHAECLYDTLVEGAFDQALSRGLEPSFRERFRAKAHGRIQQWTWDTLGKRFVKLLEHL